MELRDLQYFAVVAHQGNVTRASEILGLSPPALSKSLRRLEASVQAKLVERAPKGIALTTSGKVLLASVERLRLALEDVKREAAEVGRGEAGRLRIGVGQAEREQVSVCCSLLLRNARKLSVELDVSNNDVMVPRLLDGELDLIVNVLRETPYEGTVHERLFDDEVVVCASPSHRLARRRSLSMAEVAEERWAIATPGHIVRQALEQAFRENGLPPPEVAFETRSAEARLHVLTHSPLLGLASRRYLRQQSTARFRLVQLPVKDAGWHHSHSVGVIYRKNGYLPPAASRLIDLLRRATRPGSRQSS
jgi:DNA-binding transcriptional LysR family regulator